MSADIYGNVLTAMAILAVSAIVVPLFAGNRRLTGWLNFLLVSLAGAILLNVSYASIFGGEKSIFNLGFLSLRPIFDQANVAVSVFGFKLYLLVDGFSAFFLGIISFMAIMSAFYSVQYMEHYPDYSVKGYYVNFPLFILGMVALVTVDDLSVGFTIAWQLMTIASYFLVKYEFKKKENVRSANKYLALMELAWALIIAGTFFVQGVGIGDSVHDIAFKAGATGGVALYLVYGLILIGFGFKAGIFPFGQLWLPDAHSIAPSPISALLSGVMLKTGVYGIIRTFFWMVPHSEGAHFDGFFWGVVIACFGVVTLFIGTVQSMKQSDIKRLLAYSSIGQIGYIILAIGGALVMFHSGSAFVKLMGLVAIVGALYHVLNHAVFKGLLFLSAGSILYATGTKDMNKLGGLLKFMPISGIIAAIASLSIAGAPPFSGFASKWTIISTALLAGSEMLFLVIFGIVALFTSAVTLSCYVKFFGMTYTSSGAQWAIEKEVKEVPATMILPKVVLTLLCVVQGLIPFFYYNTIIKIFSDSRGSIVHQTFRNFDFAGYLESTAMGVSLKGMTGVTASVAVPMILLVVFAIAFVIAWALRRSAGSTERTAETWLCGYQDLHNLTRYRDSSMFSSLKNFLWWTGGKVKK
jgi:formate hydrogenlyase subunit 3/multisubunit Na+/H+ antiporter MnhD subunit